MANVGVHLESKWEPPFEDWWKITMIDHHLKALSAELLGLPGELPPRLAQLSRLIDEAIAKRGGAFEMEYTERVSP